MESTAATSAVVCGCCILRLRGVRDAQAYIKAARGLLSLEEPSAPSCAVCHGLFGQARHALMRDVRTATTGYQLQTFAITISYPPVMLVRQRAAWLHSVDQDKPDVVRYHEVVELKDALRWVLAHDLAEALRVPHDAASPFTVGLVASYADVACEKTELDAIRDLLPPPPPPKRKRWQGKAPHARPDASPVVPPHESVRAISDVLYGGAADAHIRASAVLFPPIPPSAVCAVRVTPSPAPVFLSGRYNKYSRRLPQSPWFIDGERKLADSVQDVVEAPVVACFGADRAIFSSSGREDIDVRMLGSGRPFVLELGGARRPVQTPEMLLALAAEATASGVVRVTELQYCDSALAGQLMKEGADSHVKLYRAIVHFSADFTQAQLDEVSGPVRIQQTTPLRVLQRRTLLDRPRWLHSIRLTSLTPRFAILDLATQAGTYIKEFVHGDLGRTTPSLGGLLSRLIPAEAGGRRISSDIVQLDVLGVRAPSESEGARVGDTLGECDE